jgi:hypothetical protein
LEKSSSLGPNFGIIERVVLRGWAISRRDSAEARSPQTEFKLNEVTLSPEFYDLLNRIAELQDLKLSVFTSIRSPLAQAIYLYIPSRSVHHDASTPFEISLRTLLEQVSFPIPHFPSKRKQLFKNHEEDHASPDILTPAVKSNGCLIICVMPAVNLFCFFANKKCCGFF